MESSKHNASQTLLGALDGDKAAQQIVFSEYYDLIASVVWDTWPQQLENVVGKDDLIQEVITRILESLHTVDRERLEMFPGWIKKVAKSAVLDRIRYWRAFNHGRLHVSATGPDSDGPDLIEQYRVSNSLPEKPMRREEAKTALVTAMDTLPADQKEVVHRKYFLEQSVKEIAISMGRSDGAIRMLIDRAEKNLKAPMGTQSHWLSC